MKYLAVIVLALVSVSTPVVALANCVPTTIIVNGLPVPCTICCFNGYCTTYCMPQPSE